MLLHRNLSDLDECKHEQHNEGGKQEGAEEGEVLTPLCSPESVSSQADHNHRCENRRQ